MYARICYKMHGGGNHCVAFYDSNLDHWIQAPNIFCAVFDFIDHTVNKIASPYIYNAFLPRFHLQ